ncbi:Pycsar system effector family protein [Saccharopolyspora sp. CA-218241]|uniref:Pycsar system effector family protein n=1 Tax=Saccharopolyspora sp. CA-218241 TaxID=3240027 RepID=UPI003D951D0E
MAGIIALTRTNVSVPGLVLLYLAAIPATAAVVLLLWTIRPYLGSAHTGFLRWALFTGDAAALVEDFDRRLAKDTQHEAEHLAVLSALAVAKYRRIAGAVALLLTALPIAALALIAA